MTAQNLGYFRGAKSPKPPRLWLLLLLAFLLGVVFCRADVIFANGALDSKVFFIQFDTHPVLEFSVPPRSVLQVPLDASRYGYVGIATADTVSGWGWSGLTVPSGKMLYVAAGFETYHYWPTFEVIDAPPVASSDSPHAVALLIVIVALLAVALARIFAK